MGICLGKYCKKQGVLAETLNYLVVFLGRIRFIRSVRRMLRLGYLLLQA